MGWIQESAAILKHALIPFQINRDVGHSTVETQKSLPFVTDHVRFRNAVPAGLENVLIFMLFTLFAAQAPPDINESHYLTKAKHFWNPDWCPGDLFLSSSFSHWLFYFSCGWLTQFFSLATFAWIGRIGTWAMMAFAWQRLSWRLVPRPMVASFSALVFLLLNDRFHLAGEWVVGGFEAKGIAYCFVLLAVGEMIVARWQWVWPWLGLAAAFHVLVGGWAMLATGFAWILSQPMIREPFGLSRDSWFAQWSQAFKDQLKTLPIGLGLVIVGAIPPLLADQNALPENIEAASLIYVHQRVAHHLTFSAFPTIHVARFVLLILFWMCLFRFIHKSQRERSSYDNAYAFNILFRFGLGSLLISSGGLVLSGIAESSEAWRVVASRLLCFYWFRLSDFAIPATTALAMGWLVGNWLLVGRSRSRRICAGLVAATIVAAGGLLMLEKQVEPIPNADRRLAAGRPDDGGRRQEFFANWCLVCAWIDANTPRDAVFITPLDQQTFKWYAGRTEVVNRKDIPQDADAIVEWSHRFAELLEPQQQKPLGLMTFPDDHLRALAKKYRADYLLVPQWQVDWLPTPPDLKQVYPVNRNARSTFVVFAFEGPESSEP